MPSTRLYFRHLNTSGHYSLDCGRAGARWLMGCHEVRRNGRSHAQVPGVVIKLLTAFQARNIAVAVLRIVPINWCDRSSYAPVAATEHKLKDFGQHELPLLSF